MLTGKISGQTVAPLRVHAVYDVLMRPVAGDGGAWLDLALQHRFVSNETVQHPLSSQVTVVPRVLTAGSLTPHMDLQVMALRVGDEDMITVQGYCRPTGLASAMVKIKLWLVGASGEDPKPLEQELDQAGGWVTESLVSSRKEGTWPDPTTFALAGPTAYTGDKRFHLTIVDLKDFVPPTLRKNTVDAAQFLSFNQSDLQLKFVRLNSLFGPELVQRSNGSVDAVLDWNTQFIAEPSPTGVPFVEPNGAFNGANGLFFWELFFHLPHLMATRLRDEERFREAQNWLHYVFDPQATADPREHPDYPNPRPAYWRCRPWTSSELQAIRVVKFRTPRIRMPSATQHRRTCRFWHSPTM